MQIEKGADKNILRKDILKRRNELNEADIKYKSEKILDKLISLSEIVDAKNVCIYVSKECETDTTSLIERFIAMGKNVFAPRSDIQSNSMTFYKVNSLEELSLGAFSILEPSCDNEKYVYSDNDDVCIVPALSFDKNGYRLGYGKGYYDRFLKDFMGIKIGICFNEYITEVLPRYDTDIAVDMIITEDENYCCKGGK